VRNHKQPNNSEHARPGWAGRQKVMQKKGLMLERFSKFSIFALQYPRVSRGSAEIRKHFKDIDVYH
jgi:hypothetical protein